MKIRPAFKLIWAIQPLSRFLLLFIIGLFVAYLQPFNVFLVLFVLVLTFISSVLLYRSKRYRSKYQIGYFLSFIVFLSGVFLGNRYHKDVNGLSNAVLYKKQFYLIKVTSEPTIKDSVLSFNADFYLSDSTGANRSIHFISSRSSVLGGSNLAIEIGQFALVYARLENPPKPTLPGEFDYEAYLRRKGVFAISRFTCEDFLKLSLKEFSFKSLFLSFRNDLIQKFHSYGLFGDRLAIASALLLGARSDISDDLNEAYSHSGITHILAVSGMHVGLVFAAVSFFLRKIKRKFLVCLLSLTFLWGYACLTGLSPSVTRAAWMFSFIVCGKLFRSGHQKWNSIAASGLLMLVIDPFIWLDAGFQLSFSAVWGIVALGKLPEKFSGMNKWLKVPLEAAWISCIAQLCTLPVSLFIFGKFPIYFLLANLITVPLSTILTYWGILCLLVFPVPLIAHFFCTILCYGIDLMNFVASFISNLPFSTFDGLHINLVHSVLIALLIYLFSSSFLSFRRKVSIALRLILFSSLVLFLQCFTPVNNFSSLYHSSNKFGIITYNRKSARNYNLFDDGVLNEGSSALISFEKHLQRSSLKLHFKDYNESDRKFKSFLVNTNINGYLCLIFVNPSDLDLNPFCLNFPKHFNTYIVLMPGGKYKWRQFWKLVSLRKRIKLMEMNSKRLKFNRLAD
jgi:competence protein ComEC